MQRIRPAQVRQFEEWLDQGAGAYDAGFTLNSCDFTLPQAVFFWSKGWEGCTIDQALTAWKDKVRHDQQARLSETCEASSQIDPDDSSL